MKTLILSCNTGEGHNSVSEALRQAFEAAGSCQVKDALAFLSKKASELVSSFHTGMYRHAPKLYRSTYRYSESHRTLYDENTPVFKLLASGVERLYAYILEEGFTHILCPHVFSGLMVTLLLRQHPQEQYRTAFIATDYTCSPMVEESCLDWYFVPGQEVVSEFIAAGIPAEKILVISGIPVREEFFKRAEICQAKKSLGLAVDSRHILMMFGSMGCGPRAELTECFLERLGPEDTLSIVCGTNTQIKRKLERICKGQDNVRIYGFCQDISLLMDSADLYLTKPGGISTAESAAKGLPMVLCNVVSSCEGYNLQHFCSLGGAVTAEKPEKLVNLCVELLGKPEKRAEMAAALISQGRSAQEIFQKMTEAAL